MSEDFEHGIREASIAELRAALAAGRLSATALVCRYLNRIAHYDRHGIRLNAVPILNPQLFAEARPWANDSPYVPDGSIESLRRRLEAGEEIGCSDAIVALANEAPALLVTFGDQLVARVLDEHADG